MPSRYRTYQSLLPLQRGQLKLSARRRARQKKKHASLRVAIGGRVVIIIFTLIFLLAVVFVFLIWFLAKEEISSYQKMREVRIGAFWMAVSHTLIPQIVRFISLANAQQKSKGLLALAAP